jgi:hypothetical protein
MSNSYDVFSIETSNNKDYKNINDIPKKDYHLIHTAKDIHPIYFTNLEFFNKIKDWVNLRFVSFDIVNYDKNKDFLNEIAIFQKLSLILIIDYKYSDFTYIDKGKYIHHNKMLIFSPKDEDFDKIPSKVEYLNILNHHIYRDYTNIPINIKHLHLSQHNRKFILQSNLPINLESLTITTRKVLSPDIEKIKNFTKLPFNCEFFMDVI